VDPSGLFDFISRRGGRRDTAKLSPQSHCGGKRKSAIHFSFSGMHEKRRGETGGIPFLSEVSGAGVKGRGKETANPFFLSI